MKTLRSDASVISSPLPQPDLSASRFFPRSPQISSAPLLHPLVPSSLSSPSPSLVAFPRAAALLRCFVDSLSLPPSLSRPCPSRRLPPTAPPLPLPFPLSPSLPVSHSSPLPSNRFPSTLHGSSPQRGGRASASSAMSSTTTPFGEPLRLPPSADPLPPPLPTPCPTQKTGSAPRKTHPPLPYPIPSHCLISR